MFILGRLSIIWYLTYLLQSPGFPPGTRYMYITSSLFPMLVLILGIISHNFVSNILLMNPLNVVYPIFFFPLSL